VIAKEKENDKKVSSDCLKTGSNQQGKEEEEEVSSF
jgi:hypothetical protein